MTSDTYNLIGQTAGRGHSHEKLFLVLEPREKPGLQDLGLFDFLPDLLQELAGISTFRYRYRSRVPGFQSLVEDTPESMFVRRLHPVLEEETTEKHALVRNL